jgi:hypothetical protein
MLNELSRDVSWMGEGPKISSRDAARQGKNKTGRPEKNVCE